MSDVTHYNSRFFIAFLVHCFLPLSLSLSSSMGVSGGKMVKMVRLRDPIRDGQSTLDD